MKYRYVHWGIKVDSLTRAKRICAMSCRTLAFHTILSLLFLCIQAASLFTHTPSQFSFSACSTSTCVSSSNNIVYGTYKLGDASTISTYSVTSDGRISFSTAKSVDVYYSPASADTFIGIIFYFAKYSTIC